MYVHPRLALWLLFCSCSWRAVGAASDEPRSRDGDRPRLERVTSRRFVNRPGTC